MKEVSGTRFARDMVQEILCVQGIQANKIDMKLSKYWLTGKKYLTAQIFLTIMKSNHPT